MALSIDLVVKNIFERELQRIKIIPLKDCKPEEEACIIKFLTDRIDEIKTTHKKYL